MPGRKADRPAGAVALAVPPAAEALPVAPPPEFVLLELLQAAAPARVAAARRTSGARRNACPAALPRFVDIIAYPAGRASGLPLASGHGSPAK